MLPPFFSSKQNRAALELSGPEVDKFLNDVLTAELYSLPVGQMRMSCLLSPQGRILHDMLIFRIDIDCYWIEVSKNQVQDLKKRLMVYKLRKAISIEHLQNWFSAHIYYKDKNWFSVSQVSQIRNNLAEGEFIFEDSRRPELGFHIISKDHIINSKNKNWIVSDLSVWETIRIANMVPFGDVDLTPNRALMIEANLDLFSAVDFQKGCYIGQEVTARTKYRGLIKRQLVPVLSSTPLKQHTLILVNDKKIGVCHSSVRLHEHKYLTLATIQREFIKLNLEDEKKFRTSIGFINIQLPCWYDFLNHKINYI